MQRMVTCTILFNQKGTITYVSITLLRREKGYANNRNRKNAIDALPEAKWHVNMDDVELRSDE